MSKGPGLFADIGKKAKGNQSIYFYLWKKIKINDPTMIIYWWHVDLLTRDYNSDQKFSVSTYSDAGVVCVYVILCCYVSLIFLSGYLILTIQKWCFDW